MNSKKAKLRVVLPVAVLILLAVGSVSAQISAFDGANELMMTEQSMFLNFLGNTFGPDPASKLHFTSVVDRKGQSFSFSLDPGSMYMGQPMKLSVSGELDSSDQWHISSSGNYRGSDFTVDSKYISALASGFGFKEETPAYNGALSNIYFANMWKILPECCWYQGYTISVACSNVWSLGTVDYQYCYQVYDLIGGGSGGPVTGSAWYQYSTVHLAAGGNSKDWAFNSANTGANYWGMVDSLGTSPTDGSQGSSTAVLSPLKVDTTSFFSDLGIGANVYNPSSGWQVSGNGAVGGSFIAASQFTPTSSGQVSKIDIGIAHNSGANSFYAALYFDDGGVPGNILARWDNLSSSLDVGACCGVVSITDITGVGLAAGVPYYLVLGAEDGNGSTSMSWNTNSQSVSGYQLYSKDGGGTWNSGGQQLLGAFDVVTQPQGILVEAEQFQLANPSTITQVDLALGYVKGDNSVNVVIAADNGGQPGNRVYESSNFAVNQHYSGCCGLVSVNTELNLQAGNYWLMVMPSNTDSNTEERWYRNSTGAIGTNAFSLDGGVTWNSRGEQALGAFDVRFGQEVLYSNLGTKDQVYQCCSGYPVTGGASTAKLLSDKAVTPASGVSQSK